jgi:signal peptidase I
MPLIKRVIATEGQTVNIDAASGEVSVDGVVLTNPISTRPPRCWERQKFPLTVPEGTVFVMGDNRNRSKDSRFLGPIQLDYLVGRVYFRLFPLSKKESSVSNAQGGNYARSTYHSVVSRSYGTKTRRLMRDHMKLV